MVCDRKAASFHWSFSSTLLQAGALKCNSSKNYKGRIVLSLTTRMPSRWNLKARLNYVGERQILSRGKQFATDYVELWE